jgi:HEAT repeat protein
MRFFWQALRIERLAVHYVCIALALLIITPGCKKGPEGNAALLIRDLREATGNARETERLVGELAKIGEPAIEPLVALFAEDDRLLIDAASEALSRIPDSVPVLERVALDRQNRTEVRAMACTTLSKMQDARSIDSLLQVSKDPDPQLRPYAIRALGGLRDQRAFDELVLILQSGDKDDAGAAGLALGRYGDRRATPIILNEIRNRQDGRRYAMIAGLGLMRDPAALATLLEVARGKDVQAMTMAIEAIGRIAETGDSNSRQALLEMISEVGFPGRFDAILAFGPIATEADLSVLQKAANDREAQIRTAAQRVIDRLVTGQR